MLGVSRIVQGQHSCRTRVMFIGNPGNPSQQLKEFRRSADGIPDMFSMPFIARLHFALPSREDDVPIADINSPNRALST